ncbi:MAG: hypothetical protein L3K16_02790 [Thermoplasmata archaeon]|nr:hypothetical protein [Thermoplasmata archaeon]
MSLVGADDRMTGDFAGIEGLVAVVGAGAIGGALALRLAHPARRDEALRFRAAALALVPAGVVAVLALVIGGWKGGAGRGVPFDQGLAIGLVAAALVVVLEPRYELEGPGLTESELRADRSWCGVGAAGVALLALLAVLLLTGSGPAGLFGVAAGAALVLLLGEPESRFNVRLRFVGFVTTLAVATAFVPTAAVFRSIVPDALLMPLAFGAVATVAGAIGVAVDRIHGPYHWGVAAAGIAAAGIAVVAVVTWYWNLGIALAVTAGWLGAGTTLYALRFGVYEKGQADAIGRAGVALGAIGSIANGLQAVGVMILAIAGSALIAVAAILTFAPDGTFGLLLAGVGATGAALGLGGLQVGTGPGGGPRHIPEAFDTVAMTWAPLTTVFALAAVVPSITGVPAEVVDANLTLGVPGILVGLVLGALVPFVVASAGRPPPGVVPDRRVRWAVAIAPAGVVVAVSLALGAGAAVGAVLGAAMTGVPLGLFWAATREASASLQTRLPAGSSARRALFEAFDAPTGWRIAASVLAVTVSALAVVVVFAPATTFLGS